MSINWVLTPDWLTAIGTISAVVVALLVSFYSGIRKKILEPKLTIEFDNKIPYCRHSPIVNEVIINETAHESRNPEGYFFRIRVRNTGKSTAKKVEAKLVRILNIDTKEEATDYDPTHIVWVGYGNDNAIDIPRGLYEYANVCFVKDNANNLFISTTETSLRGIALVRERLDCILHIVVLGTNTNTVERYYKLHVGSGFLIKYDDVTLTEMSVQEVKAKA